MKNTLTRSQRQGGQRLIRIATVAAAWPNGCSWAMSCRSGMSRYAVALGGKADVARATGVSRLTRAVPQAVVARAVFVLVPPSRKLTILVDLAAASAKTDSINFARAGFIGR
jgi:hypothetical protein